MYARLVGAQVRAQIRYKVSFTVDLVATTLAAGLDLGTVLVLFRVAPDIAGFGVRQGFLIASLASCGFASADFVMGNIDRLQNIIRLGTLDAVMVRPLSVLCQLLAGEFALRRVGRVIQGITVYGVALAAAHVRPTPAHVVLAVLAPLCGLVFFASWFLAGATISFWWIDSGEFASGFTYGGRDFVAYPVTVYSGLFRRVFGYGLGFAFIAYYPSLVLLDRPDPLGLPPWTGWCAPAVAMLAARIASALWRIGVRQYMSTGS